MKKLYDGMQRFCAAHPRFGIPNLMRVIVIGNVAVYVLMLLTQANDANALSFLTFNLNALLHGEVWRLVTFVFVPAYSSPFALLISLYFYYWIGSTLERQWGTAKFNLYYISGALLTVLGVVLASLITGNPYLTAAGTGYVNLSMFFAFAFLFPDTQLLLFFFPIVLGTFFQQLYNTADAIIVGKFVGKEALAAVGGTTGTLINLLVGFFVGLSSGASVIISQFYGARKADDVSRAVHTTMALAVTSGALLTVTGILFSEKVLWMMGTPAEVMEYAVTYIRIYFLGMIPSLIYNIGSGILRAVGDSRRPLFFLIAATMTNIVLDIVLVLGLNMGVAGAALATILSQVVSAVLVMFTLCRSPQVYRVQLKKIRFYGDMFNLIIRIGLPAGLQSVNLIIQATLNGFGTDTMAAYTAYGKIDGRYWMVINAFGVAITTFVGQNFGARLY